MYFRRELIVVSSLVVLGSVSAYADSVIGGNVFTTLSSHIPNDVNKFLDEGKLSENKNITVTLSLPLNHADELDDLIKRVYDPKDSEFHNFITPEQFKSRFSPSTEQVEGVKSYLLAQGVLPLSVSDNRMFIQAQGSVGALNSVFHTEVHQYRDAKNHAYFAPAYELQVPNGLPIQGVHGLQNVTRLKRHSFKLNVSGKPELAGSGPNGGISPSDLRTAYNIPTTSTGAGQSLALFELDGYDSTDITAYEKEFSLKAVSLANVLVGQATGTAGDGAAEVTLDIELMIATAPSASQILVYEGTNDEQGVINTYSKIASDNKASQISTSWGSSEGNNTTSLSQSENAVFKQMVAQGQALYAAAGDSGAYDDGTNLSVDDPASQPYVVAVGGTSLTFTTGGKYVSETTWSSGGSTGGGNGGGGGVSTVWTIPSWQQGVATSQNLGSTTMRNVPDVSLDADPNTGYAIYSGGSWNIYGGTSCAAPIWAAFHALINQQRALNHLASLGFPNPAYYTIGQSSRYNSDFFDIKDNSTNLHFPAVVGYDNATGWGSFNGQSLLSDLGTDAFTK